jgi:hypothetical protein
VGRMALQAVVASRECGLPSLEDLQGHLGQWIEVRRPVSQPTSLNGDWRSPRLCPQISFECDTNSIPNQVYLEGFLHNIEGGQRWHDCSKEKLLFVMRKHIAKHVCIYIYIILGACIPIIFA